MINLANIDERIQHHENRLACVDRDGWMFDAANSVSVNRAVGASNLMRRMRRSIGHAVVHCGEWLEGSPVAGASHFAQEESSSRVG